MNKFNFMIVMFFIAIINLSSNAFSSEKENVNKKKRSRPSGEHFPEEKLQKIARKEIDGALQKFKNLGESLKCLENIKALPPDQWNLPNHKKHQFDFYFPLDFTREQIVEEIEKEVSSFKQKPDAYSIENVVTPFESLVVRLFFLLNSQSSHESCSNVYKEVSFGEVQTPSLGSEMNYMKIKKELEIDRLISEKKILRREALDLSAKNDPKRLIVLDGILESGDPDLPEAERNSVVPAILKNIEKNQPMKIVITTQRMFLGDFLDHLKTIKHRPTTLVLSFFYVGEELNERETELRDVFEDWKGSGVEVIFRSDNYVFREFKL